MPGLDTTRQPYDSSRWSGGVIRGGHTLHLYFNARLDPPKSSAKYGMVKEFGILAVHVKTFKSLAGLYKIRVTTPRS